MIEDLSQFAADFAVALFELDAEAPVARNSRTGAPFRPGIGPHSEAATCGMVVARLRDQHPERYFELRTDVPYATNSRIRCDLADDHWAIEVKMLRLFGDNGKPNDNLLMHILSPYPQHRSALSDCDKLAAGRPRPRIAILIYAFEHHEWPMMRAISAFETLANSVHSLSNVSRADFTGLVHPVHKSGAVFAWELNHRSTTSGRAT